jgi:hypothetical protein
MNTCITKNKKLTKSMAIIKGKKVNEGSKEGEKVTFTFKEQQTQVDFTSKSIRDYILSLGEMEGVAGSMAAISETLGGKISNLGDSWDNFLNALGQRTSGMFKSVIERFSGMLNSLIGQMAAADFMMRAGVEKKSFIERKWI